jgi:hypothetical protein
MYNLRQKSENVQLQERIKANPTKYDFALKFFWGRSASI